MRNWPSIFPALFTLLLSGCLQMETRIKLNEDGSAVVTERLQISRELLEIEAGVKEQLGATFKGLLSRERAQRRAGAMGSGVTLVSHKMDEGQAGSLRAVTVYRVGDITELTYVSPFFMRGEHLGTMRIGIKPSYEGGFKTTAGLLMLVFSHGDPRAEPSAVAKELTTLEQDESPLIRQRYRDIAPALRDLLKGFKIRMVFENFSEIVGGRKYFHNERPKELDIINYTYGGEPGGKTGTHPLDDEEVVVDLMKLLLARPDSPWSRRQGRFLGPHASGERFGVMIRPSRPLFDRYFKGKNLSIRQGAGRPNREMPARFEDIGDTAENRRDAIREKE